MPLILNDDDAGFVGRSGTCWSRWAGDRWYFEFFDAQICMIFRRKVSRKCNENCRGGFSLHFCQLLRSLGQQCRQLGLLLILVLFFILKSMPHIFFTSAFIADNSGMNNYN